MASKQCVSTRAGTEGAVKLDAGVGVEATEVDGITAGLALLAPWKETIRSIMFQQFFLM